MVMVEPAASSANALAAAPSLLLPPPSYFRQEPQLERIPAPPIAALPRPAPPLSHSWEASPSCSSASDRERRASTETTAETSPATTPFTNASAVVHPSVAQQQALQAQLMQIHAVQGNALVPLPHPLQLHYQQQLEPYLPHLVGASSSYPVSAFPLPPPPPPSPFAYLHQPFLSSITPPTIPSTTIPSTIPPTIPPPTISQTQSSYYCHHCFCRDSKEWYQSTSTNSTHSSESAILLLCRTCVESFSCNSVRCSTAAAAPETSRMDARAFPSLGTLGDVATMESDLRSLSSIYSLDTTLFPLLPPPPQPPVSSLGGTRNRFATSPATFPPQSLSHVSVDEMNAMDGMETVELAAFEPLTSYKETTTTATPTTEPTENVEPPPTNTYVPFQGTSAVTNATSCSNCHTRVTSMWRRGNNDECLCNACGLYLKIHHAMRPLSMKKNVVRKRNRTGGSVKGALCGKRSLQKSASTPVSGIATTSLTVAAEAGVAATGVQRRKKKKDDAEGDGNLSNTLGQRRRSVSEVAAANWNATPFSNCPHGSAVK